MQSSGFQIKQIRPTGPQTAISSPSMLTELTTIYVCNPTAAAIPFRLFHDAIGATYDLTTALFYDKVVPANDTIIIKGEMLDGGISVLPGGTVGVEGDGLTFTFYGANIKVHQNE